MQTFPKPATSAAMLAGTAARLPSELALWLERTLGAAAGWAGSAGEARDAALRALAQRFYPCVPVSTQAARINMLAETYAFVNWPRDRERAQVPTLYRETPDEFLWAAFKSGAPMPLAQRDLRRILIGAAEGDG
jgi:hypothetical protein